MKLSIIIPAYNEEKTLPDTLRDIHGYLLKQDYDYEIIINNDNSKDKTADVVRGLQGEIKNLYLIDNKVNRGKGAGVKKGMLRAKGEIRLFMDADNSTNIREIEKMWPEFEKGADIVIASRDLPDSELTPPQPLYRRILGEIFGLFTSIILGLWGIKDTQCGFKAMRANVAMDIMPLLTVERWAIDPEILALAKKRGYKIKEIPVRWINRAESRVKFFGKNSMFNMIVNLLRIRWNLLTNKYG